MKAEMKVKATVNSGDKPLLLATIRTEHEIVITADSLVLLSEAVKKLADNNELVARDKAHFAWELSQLLDLFREYQEKPYAAMRHLQSEWQPITGYLSLDTLKAFDDSTKKLKSMRIEGSPETGLSLVLQSGIDTLVVPADRARLASMKAEVETSKQSPEVQASAAIAEWVIAVGILMRPPWPFGIAGTKNRKRSESKRSKSDATKKKSGTNWSATAVNPEQHPTGGQRTLT